MIRCEECGCVLAMSSARGWYWGTFRRNVSRQNVSRSHAAPGDQIVVVLQVAVGPMSGGHERNRLLLACFLSQETGYCVPAPAARYWNDELPENVPRPVFFVRLSVREFRAYTLSRPLVAVRGIDNTGIRVGRYRVFFDAGLCDQSAFRNDGLT